jgi:hypothetical protein
MLPAFGSGILIGWRTDITGVTPVPFASLQSVSRDFSFTEKPLMGQNQNAIFIARGGAKHTIKAKTATLSAKLFNAIFFGGTVTTGGTALAQNEAHTVPTSSPFTVAATVTTFTKDAGVTYAGYPPGLPLTAETSSPAAIAQYLASTTGTYTFSSSDAGANLLFNYLYSVTTGETIALTNQLLGTTPTFSGVFSNRDPASGKWETLVVNRMTSTKLSLGSKLEDWDIPEFDMSIFDDGTGNIGTWSFGDLS